MIKHRTLALNRNKGNAMKIKEKEDEFIERKQQQASQSNVLLNNNKQAINSTLFDPIDIQDATFSKR